MLWLEVHELFGYGRNPLDTPVLLLKSYQKLSVWCLIGEFVIDGLMRDGIGVKILVTLRSSELVRIQTTVCPQFIL